MPQTTDSSDFGCAGARNQGLPIPQEYTCPACDNTFTLGQLAKDGKTCTGCGIMYCSEPCWKEEMGVDGRTGHPKRLRHRPNSDKETVLHVSGTRDACN
ncbi:hypothetical protein BJ508DRAFT_412941 [Ascobolus immersus RN42]|uniref:Uncharacterized protein n=1 Tax=Ascobolus immersus RN42 TaxID=1160509 RepID=A0A3N4IF70_ASCIM|nr:hypothetical protein BJ508DRAFT_412941 [Ascobolus immersus RN42]